MKFSDFLKNYEAIKEKNNITESLVRCKFTSKNVSELFAVKLLTVKRWAREFFTDKTPQEIQKEGVARIFTIDDVFIFYLIKHLLKFELMSIAQIKEFIKKTKNWLKTKGLVPSMQGKMRRNNFIDNYTIYVCLAQEDMGILYKRVVLKDDVKIDELREQITKNLSAPYYAKEEFGINERKAIQETYYIDTIYPKEDSYKPLKTNVSISDYFMTKIDISAMLAGFDFGIIVFLEEVINKRKANYENIKF